MMTMTFYFLHNILSKFHIQTLFFKHKLCYLLHLSLFISCLLLLTTYQTLLYRIFQIEPFDLETVSNENLHKIEDVVSADFCCDVKLLQ